MTYQAGTQSVQGLCINEAAYRLPFISTRVGHPLRYDSQSDSEGMFYLTHSGPERAVHPLPFGSYASSCPGHVDRHRSLAPAVGLL